MNFKDCPSNLHDDHRICHWCGRKSKCKVACHLHNLTMHNVTCCKSMDGESMMKNCARCLLDDCEPIKIVLSGFHLRRVIKIDNRWRVF